MKSIQKLTLISATVAIALTFSGCRTERSNPLYRGFVRQSGNVYLMENHCHALIAWHMNGIRDATLVHIDAHDDCRPVSAGKLTDISELLQSESYDTLFERSDTEQFLNFKRKDADMLYDLGNFIFPSMKLGIISDVYWIIPQPVINEFERNRLASLMKKNLPGSRITSTRFPHGGFELEWDSHLFRVITFEELPQLPAGCLIDFDTDVFAFERAMTEDHIIGNVNRNPEDVFEYLKTRVPQPAAVTVSASVWGGYLPLMLRFLADAAFDSFATGSFPQDADTLLAAYRSLLKSSSVSLPDRPESDIYLPAFLHFKAMTGLSSGNTDECIRLITKASSISSVYRKGFLDAAEGFISMKRYRAAERLIDEFEKHSGGETYNSLAVRAIALLEQNKTDSALELSTRLTEWDSNPYTLLIHGSALTASGHTTEAMKTFTDMLESAPDNASAHFNTGLIHQSNGDIDAAIAAYRRAITVNPGLWQAQENLGHLLLKRNKLADAERALRNALLYNPYSATSLNNLGLTLGRQSRYTEAIPVFRKSLSFADDDITIKLNLAEALYSAEKLKEAENLCREVLDASKNKRAQNLIKRIQEQNGSQLMP